MQIRGLTLTGGRHGLHVTGGSTGLTVERLVARDNARDGLRLEGGSDFILLKEISSYNHPTTANGIHLEGGAGGTIENVRLFNNNIGLYSTVAALRAQNLTSFNNVYGLFSGGPSLTVTSARLYFNRTTGLYEYAGGTGVWTDLDVYGNGAGIEATGVFTIDGARVYENLRAGISSSGRMTIRAAEVYGNTDGVSLYTGSITNSRIYSNQRYGVWAGSALTLTDNTIHSNDTGIYSQANGVIRIENNLIYADRTAGIRLASASPSQVDIFNNTIYEPMADGIAASDGVHDLHLRNNIIWTQAGYGVRIANDSQRGFSSNFNLLYATGTAKVGFWQGDRLTLNAWQAATLGDADSVSSDPLFVDPDGADGILGSPFDQGLTARFYFGNTLAALAGNPAFTRVDRQVDFASFSGPPVSAVPDENWSGRWQGYLRIDTAGTHTLFVNALGPPPELFGFLRHNARELLGRYGSVSGVRIPSPRLIRAA
jgi:hypothetical protein